jgi:hypothetical protein
MPAQQKTNARVLVMTIVGTALAMAIAAVWMVHGTTGYWLAGDVSALVAISLAIAIGVPLIGTLGSEDGSSRDRRMIMRRAAVIAAGVALMLTGVAGGVTILA